MKLSVLKTAACFRDSFGAVPQAPASGFLRSSNNSFLKRYHAVRTMQLMELGIPMVLAINMMDEVRANGGSVRVNELEEILGIPVVPISAAKNEGTTELIDHALHAARHRESPGRVDFCPASNNEHDSVGAALSDLMGMGIDVLRRLQL